MSGTLNLFDRKAPPPTCFECDHVAEHRHHVVPRSMGGTRTVWLCTKCHAAAHHFEKDPWMDHRRLTKKGLAEAKARGVKLGTSGKSLAKRQAARADKTAANLSPVVAEIKAAGHTTLRAITQEMNRRKVPTATDGGAWHLNTIQRLVKRIERLESP